MNKIKYFLLILLVIVVVFFIYKSNFTKKIIHNNISNEQSNLDNSYNIFPANIKYEDLSKENKELIIKISRLKNLTKEDVSLFALIYNDNKIALIKYSNQKGMYGLELFDVKNNKFIEQAFTPSIRIQSSNSSYLVFTYDNKLYYYKAGEGKYTLIGGSNLKDTESYIASEGPGGSEEDIKIDNLNIVTAGVYDAKINDSGLYKKIREVQFILP